MSALDCIFSLNVRGGWKASTSSSFLLSDAASVTEDLKYLPESAFDVFWHHKNKNRNLSSEPEVTSPAASCSLLACIWSHFKKLRHSLSCNVNAAGVLSGLHTALELLLWKPLMGIVYTTMVWLTALYKASHSACPGCTSCLFSSLILTPTMLCPTVILAPWRWLRG